MRIKLLYLANSLNITKFLNSECKILITNNFDNIII